MRVDLTYFKPSGKYYSNGEYDTVKTGLWEIFAEVEQMRNEGRLPDLVEGAKEFAVLVDVPEHPHRHPALIPYLELPDMYLELPDMLDAAHAVTDGIARGSLGPHLPYCSCSLHRLLSLIFDSVDYMAPVFDPDEQAARLFVRQTLIAADGREPDDRAVEQAAKKIADAVRSARSAPGVER